MIPTLHLLKHLKRDHNIMFVLERVKMLSQNDELDDTNFLGNY